MNLTITQQGQTTAELTASMRQSLRYKHKQDIYIDEFACHIDKKYFLMDAWTTEYGYDKHCIGYEIKASREDFVRDKKWHNYLDFCHYFYFVCPKGLINPEELPENVGLIYFNPKISTTTHTLRIKKKAKNTGCELKTKTWKYIMMQISRKLESAERFK